MSRSGRGTPMTEPDDQDPSRTTIARPNVPVPPPNTSRLPVLVVLRGAQVGRRYLLNEDSLVLGRMASKVDLVIPEDPQVSGVHCRIERVVDAWQVVDLASTNGTLVAGERVTTVGLREGDRIHIGETVLEFTFHDELEDEFHRRVDHLMNIDDLTGLPVQRVFQQRFQEALVRYQLASQRLAFFMMDMDGLKKINDTHGHFVGANSIATVGRRLGALIAQAGGTVSRFGGDEFSAFAAGLSAQAALELGERARAAVADEPITVGGVTVGPTMSIGVALFPDDETTAEALTRKADAALYRAKAAGKNRVST